MTRKELPAQAVNIKRSIGSAATCTSATVDSLKSFLLDTSPRPSLGKKGSTNAQGLRPKDPPTRAAPSKTRGDKRSAKVIVLETSQDEPDTLHSNQRWALATEVVNITLKCLTDAIRNPPQMVDLKKQHLKSTLITSNLDTARTGSPLPLRPMSVNRVSAMPEDACGSQRSQSTVSANSIQGLRAQAECARIAFAALRSIQIKRLCKEMPRLQLESGMSALISKLIALGFDDLAAKELRVLKKCLDGPGKSLFTETNLGSAGLTRDSTDCSVSKRKETTANLLYFETTTDDRAILALIITSQLQALRLISTRANTITVEAALEHLRLSSSYSPANIIERLMAGASLDSQSKVAHQFESLTHLLLALCHGSATSAEEPNSKPHGGLSPHTVFGIQTLVLEVRLKWWRLSGYSGNTSKEIMEPLAQNLISLRHQSTLNPTKRYELAKQTFIELSSGTMADKNSSPVTFGFGGTPLCSIYQILADFAQESHHHDEAFQWLHDATNCLKNSGASPSKACTLSCQIANLQIRSFLAGSMHKNLLSSMKEASESLQGDLRGEAKEIDDLLSNVVALRKSAFSIFYEQEKLNKKFKPIETSSVLDECFSIILLGVKFLSRYLGKSPDQGEDEKTFARYKHRTSLVRNNTSPFFESLAAITRFSMATEMKDWERLDTGLQECVRLASVLNNLEFSKTLNPNCQHSKDLNVTPISNAYWYRYLYLKTKSGSLQEKKKPLRTSIDILKSLATPEKLAELLPARLESLGSLFEASKDYVMAVKAYTEALELLVDGGLPDDVVKDAATRPLLEVFSKKTENSTLGRLLSAFPRAALKTHNSQSESRTFFDHNSLKPDERGILLEQQLATIFQIPQVQCNSENHIHTLKSIASIVLDVYKFSEFPIRRLRVISLLLQIHFTHPGVTATELLDQVLQEKTQPLEVYSLSHDLGLRDFEAHLLQSRDVYVAILIGSFDILAVGQTLTLWHQMVQESHEYSRLQRRVNDIASWTLELEFLADYLSMQGFEMLRLKALYIIAAIQEMKPCTDASAKTSIASSIGLQCVRLGYPKEAYQALHNVRKCIDSSKASVDAVISWNLVSAEVALANGNSRKWYVKPPSIGLKADRE